MQRFVYDPGRGRFRDWLRTVTRNRLARFHAVRCRTGEPGPTPPDDLADSSLDSELADEFQARVLEAAMEQIRPSFEPQTWRAFERTWVELAGADVVAQKLSRRSTSFTRPNRECSRGFVPKC
jgi:RNA polymerase sigma-70 factor (ECF subfamily)